MHANLVWARLRVKLPSVAGAKAETTPTRKRSSSKLVPRLRWSLFYLFTTDK